MKSNATKGAANTVIRELHEEMRVYDSLPRSWRELIGSLPIPQDVIKIKQYLEVYGQIEGRRLIIEAFKQSFPDWNYLKDKNLNARTITKRRNRLSRLVNVKRRVNRS